MSTLFSKATLLCVAVALLLAFAPAQAQIVVKNEDVTFKFGIQGQLWGDWTQDSTGSQGYQQNFYLRRARIIFAGDIGKNISFFVETDDPKLGIQPGIGVSAPRCPARMASDDGISDRGRRNDRSVQPERSAVDAELFDSRRLP